MGTVDEARTTTPDPEIIMADAKANPTPLSSLDLVRRFALGHHALSVAGLNEMAPGYLVGALFDPHVVVSARKEATLNLNLAEGGGVSDLEVAGVFSPQKEPVTFHSSRAGTRVLHLARPYARLGVPSGWEILATCAELPGVVARPGEAAFAFDPIQMLTGHLDMALPDIAADLIDLMVQAVLVARGEKQDLDSDDLRRDFHALGVSYILLEELFGLFGRALQMPGFFETLRQAAEKQQEGDTAGAEETLLGCFQALEAERQKLFSAPIYIMDMPHGGILFGDEGYAEYDWPEAAARGLRMYLDWAERFAYRFAPDIGAGTLMNLNATHPKTILKLKQAWDEERIEFVNGTWAQPYLQLWDSWSQKKQFEEGLRAFDELFGRRPSTYAAQEIALHPGLPGLLRDRGFEFAIHRSQNFGTTPLDNSPLIDWEGQDGATVPTLPAHGPRSEKMGSAIYRNLPRLIKDTHDLGLPFAAITNLIDQTFIGAYKEEVVRTAGLCGLWGQFIRPSDFFRAVADTPRPKRRYALDEYDYELEFSAPNYHRYESGGFSSLLEHWLQTGRRLEADEGEGALDSAALIELLEGQSHDGYVVSYFKRGAFLDLYMTDYAGPRYKVTGDNPRGVDHYLRDCLKVPRTVTAELPVTLGRAAFDGTRLTCGDAQFQIDPDTAEVTDINGAEVKLGLLRYGAETVECSGAREEDGRLVVEGSIPGFSDVTIVYGICDDTLYCRLRAAPSTWQPDCKTPHWEDCVRLTHALPGGAELFRHCSGFSEPTNAADFFSVEALTVRTAQCRLQFCHGGNAFFRREGSELHNRLWAYNEVSDSFWWSVSAEL